MDGNMGRQTAMGLVFSRGGLSLAFREQKFEERTIKHCNRSGCSTRLYSTNGIQTGNQERVKYSRDSFHSVNSKVTSGSSKESFHSCDIRKAHQERCRQTSLRGRATAESSDGQREVEVLDGENRRWEIDNLETDGRQGEPEDSESIHIPRGNQCVFSGPVEFEPVNLQGISENASEALGSCSTRLSSRACKQVSRHRYGDRETSSSISTRHSSTSRNSSQAAKGASKGGGAESKKSGLKHLSYTSVSDALPSGCSSNSGPKRRVNTLRKESSKGGSLSARDKSMSAPLSGANSGSPRRGSSALGFSHREHLMPQQASRRRGTVSVRTSQAPIGVTRGRLPQQRHNSLSTREPQMPQTEDSSTQMFNVPMDNRNGYEHFNREEMAEVLSAPGRIEQDEGLTFEQQLVHGTNLSLDGLNFHDQHRDMRMDIDNMSYEELLALGEKMGSVSTGLPEEALSKCLKRSIYMPASTGCEEDIKCSICQEEYLAGDELGKLTCEHQFHVTCIHQWLHLKNWCPICKASTCPVS